MNRLIHVPAGLESKQLQRVAAYNSRLVEIEKRQQTIAKESIALTTRDDLPADQLESEGQRLAFESHELHREALALQPERVAILDDLSKIAADRVAKAEQQLDQTRARVERSLRKSGFSPETDPIFAANPEGARAKLQHQIRQSSDVRAAADLLADAEGEQKQIRQQIQQLKTIAADLREQLHRLNHKLLRI